VIVEVPIPTPVTTPLALPTVATVVLELLHPNVPPDVEASLSVSGVPRHIGAVPVIGETVGSGLTDTIAYAELADAHAPFCTTAW